MSVLITKATVTVEPLSFIGLMVPQLARLFGAIQIEKQLPFAALFGTLLV